MGNKNVIGILLFVVAVLLIGQLSYKLYNMNGGGEIARESQSGEGTDAGDSKDDEEVVQTISLSSKANSHEELTLLDEYLVDIDNDGMDEDILLFTAAKRDAEGRMMWDDGQNWLLEVKDEHGRYVLFEGYVQLGSINMWVYTAGEDAQYHITTIQPGSAGLEINDFRYDSENAEFEKRQIFSPQNVNMLHGYFLE